jgi:hydroxymethylpyrimidine/phosphomethylpyrimidine kinase
MHGKTGIAGSRVTKLAGLQKRISTVAKTSMSGMTAVLNITAVAILNIVKGNNSISNLLH